MRYFEAYGGPAVRVRLIDESVEFVGEVAVRAVEVRLLKLFDYHVFLNPERLFGECESEHAVAFKPE